MIAAPSSRPAVILLSPGLGSTAEPFPVEEVRALIGSRLDGARVEVAAGPLATTDAIVRAAAGARTLVLGLAGAAERVGELQARIRRAGLDPLGVRLVDLSEAAAAGPASSAARAAALLAAALASALRGGTARDVRPRAALRVTRRGVLTLAIQEYWPLPAIDRSRCAADRGCRRCVDSCHAAALAVDRAGVTLDALACTSCARCAAACPLGAVAVVGSSTAERTAELAALLDPAWAGTGRGVVFACARAAAVALRERPCWLPVRVPCVDAVGPALVLRAFALGAETVGVLDCDARCAAAERGAGADARGFCREVARAVGATIERVPLAGRAEAIEAWTLPAGVASPATAAPTAASDARWLMRSTGAGAVTHAGSPFGVLSVDATCVLCGSCATACPTAALAMRERSDEVALMFDAGRCVACGLCLGLCPAPEPGALRLVRALDPAALARGAWALATSAAVRCSGCGGLVAADAMLARVAALLAADFVRLGPAIARYCSRCRAAGRVTDPGGRPAPCPPTRGLSPAEPHAGS